MKMEIVSHNDEHHFLKQIFWDVIIALHKNYDLRKNQEVLKFLFIISWNSLILHSNLITLKCKISLKNQCKRFAGLLLKLNSNTTLLTKKDYCDEMKIKNLRREFPLSTWKAHTQLWNKCDYWVLARSYRRLI